MNGEQIVLIKEQRARYGYGRKLMGTELLSLCSTAGFCQDTQGALSDILHLFEGGSMLHGARKAEGYSDLDILGVFIERPEMKLGTDKQEHWGGGTCSDKERNKPEDIDIRLYSLSMYAHLACKGNPTILEFLFVEPASDGNVWAKLIVPNRHLFLARSHVSSFLGYAQSQEARLKGEKGLGKHGQRPELEAMHGYDVKAGMHLYRMLYSAYEFAKDGTITNPSPVRDKLMEIREGKWSQTRLFRECFEMREAIKAIEEAGTSPLPSKVDRQAVSKVLTQAYLDHWDNNGSLYDFIMGHKRI